MDLFLKKFKKNKKVCLLVSIRQSGPTDEGFTPAPKGASREARRSEMGFTLLELLISISIFTIVALIMAGSVVSVFNANKKSQALKVVMNNMNFAVEDMTRRIRFGDTYHCGDPTGTLTVPRNCSGGDSFLALSSGGNLTIYRLLNNQIQRSDDGGSEYIGITAPSVNIQTFQFYVLGSADTDDLQPWVVLVIRGFVGTKPVIQSTFDIQTTISQRSIDISL